MEKLLQILPFLTNRWKKQFYCVLCHCSLSFPNHQNYLGPPAWTVSLHCSPHLYLSPPPRLHRTPTMNPEELWEGRTWAHLELIATGFPLLCWPFLLHLAAVVTTRPENAAKSRWSRPRRCRGPARSSGAVAPKSCWRLKTRRSCKESGRDQNPGGRASLRTKPSRSAAKSGNLVRTLVCL